MSSICIVRNFKIASIVIVAALCLIPSPPQLLLSAAQELDESFDHWPVDVKINGQIIVANQLRDSNTENEVDAYFLRASGGAKADLVTIVLNTKMSEEDLQAALLSKKFSGAATSRIVTACACAAEPAPKRPPLSKELIKEATGVMLLTDDNGPLDARQKEEILHLRDDLREVLKRGGVVYARGGPAVKLLSRVEITITGGSGNATLTPQIAEGLNLIPDSVIETDFSSDAADDDDDRLRRVQSVLASHPSELVAIGLETNTAAALDGRILRVLGGDGGGRATVMIAANDEREPFRAQTIERRRQRGSNGRQGRQSPNDYLIDWTQWRRLALERTLEPFPPAELQTPYVENGTLVIVGGGTTPEGLMERFVKLAGGLEDARLVYVPCTDRDELSPAPPRTVQVWETMGVRRATFVHTKDRRRANDDEAFLAPLRDATGIWFGTGRQWNLADSYYGTTAHKLMKRVLRRGGVVGGSSAGASIQARYLARSTPIGNVDIVSPGYERGGLGFIDGVAIDQHFSQRGRHKDMTQLVDRYPQLLGVGLDEATAIVVQQSMAEVVGRGKAHFYDRNQPVHPGGPDFVALPAGSFYDLAERTIVQDATTLVEEPPPE